MSTHSINHLAIIMDGNGRWAEQQKLPRLEGHVAGLDAVKRTVQACLALKIPVLSLFAFSSENWSRPAEEVQGLMQLFIQALNQEIEKLHKQNISIRFSGDLTKLSTELQNLIAHATKLTANNHKLTLNIAMNYGGKWDILQATRKIAKMVEMQQIAPDAITEETIESLLNTAPLPTPDLLIRTSGENRISNFFLWQIAYTELYFSSALWPDFNEQNLKDAILNFQSRQRRYGTTSCKTISC